MVTTAASHEPLGTSKNEANKPAQRRFVNPAIAAFGGLLAALASPPSDWIVGMPFGLLLLAISLYDCKRFWHGFVLASLWGTVAGLIGMRFVPTVIQVFTDLGVPASLLAHALLSVGQSLPWAIGMGVAVMLRRRLSVPFWLAFAVGALMAISLPTLFVWTPAGVMSKWPALLQSAAYIGERGVTVLLAVAMALYATSLVACREHARKNSTDRKSAHSRRHMHVAARSFAAAGGIVALMLAHGLWSMSRIPIENNSDTRIALVHAGVHPKVRWKRDQWQHILTTLQKQTALAEKAGVDLTIWPEAAYPYPLTASRRHMPRGKRQIRNTNVTGPVLFGAITHAPVERLPSGAVIRDRFNSALLMHPDGSLSAPYHKMALLPFGEAVPLGEHWPWLRRKFARSGGLRPGQKLRRLDWPRQGKAALKMGILNCYEDTLPWLGRQIMSELSPNLLVNVTNDAWFVGTHEPKLHARLAVMRSIELRRDMVRAVNLGVIGWIDAAGRVRAAYESPKPGRLIVRPTLRNGTTLYARFGDLPMGLLLVASVSWFAVRRRQQASSECCLN